MTLINTSPILLLVRSALTGFVNEVEKKFSIKVPDSAWIPLPPVVAPGCPCLMKHGPRAQQPCNKKLAKGKTMCSIHSKAPAPKEGNVGNVPATTQATAVPVQMCRRTAFGNYAYDGLVVDKLTKCVYGREMADGTIVPLSADDRKICVSNKYVVQDSSPQVKEASVQETVEELVEETVEEDLSEEPAEEDVEEELVEEPVEEDVDEITL